MEEKELLKAVLELTNRKDSLEWGTASKGGARKVYTDFLDWDATKARIDAANKAAEYAIGNGVPK